MNPESAVEEEEEERIKVAGAVTADDAIAHKKSGWWGVLLLGFIFSAEREKRDVMICKRRNAKKLVNLL